MMRLSRIVSIALSRAVTLQCVATTVLAAEQGDPWRLIIFSAIGGFMWFYGNSIERRHHEA